MTLRITRKAAATVIRRMLLVAALLTLAALGTAGLGLAQPAPSQAPPPATSTHPPLPLPPAEGCRPGSVLPGCQTSTESPSAPPETTPAPSTPCSGPGCLPSTDAAPVPGSGNAPPPSPTESSQQESSCGITNISACVRSAVESFIRSLVAPALDGLLGLMSSTILTTPPFTALPRLRDLWQSSWQILVGCYGLLVVIAGAVVMAHESLQTRTSIKETLPRVIVGFLAGSLSLWIGEKAIDLANALAEAVSSDGVDQQGATKTLTTLMTDTQHGGFFLLFLGLLLALMVGAVVLTYIVRVALTVILLAGAPLMLMCHALPQTEGIARWWWKAFGGCLAIQLAQSLTLVTALRVFLTPSGFSMLFPAAAGFVNVLVAMGLMYILFKIPFWILGSIRGGSGRSFVGSLVKSVIAAKTFGLLRGAGAAAGASRTGRGPHRTQSTSNTDPDLYANPRSTPDGQYLLPLGGLKRGRPPKPPHQRYAPQRARTSSRTPRGRQLRLPTDGEWPENKPTLQTDGQYRMAMPATRVAKPAEPTTEARPQQRDQQLRLPTDGEWPENKPRLGADGQYRLPIQAQRVRKPAPPPPSPAASPSSPRPRARQLKLPADGEWPEEKPRLGRDGQYRLPLNVQRTRKPPQADPPTSSTGGGSAARTPRARQRPLPLNLPTKRRPRPRPRGEGSEQ